MGGWAEISTARREGSMVYKLRKVVYSISFWVLVFGLLVLTNTIWSLTHP